MLKDKNFVEHKDKNVEINWLHCSWIIAVLQQSLTLTHEFKCSLLALDAYGSIGALALKSGQQEPGTSAK